MDVIGKLAPIVALLVLAALVYTGKASVEVLVAFLAGGTGGLFMRPPGGSANPG
jgi:hypothetical protein